ncbi:YtpR family tRNA-binding protein [Weissella koreensis]|uniref:DUF4479 domain-containing protein n=1 Tax=Weissella koreensis TaxID=165096 RepID=A0A7H1MNE5_9LACO|nr:DUF4479 and tRNA-binding domain-containing protein [Weissella koreensis]AVH75779.1 tRNA-binding protein [Weissella koreensis]QGN21000.1 DUF4479 domain-containing protein [Weissella koreensis]QNT64981.1 DUF4479 domain-containing protein [Weissella koreensis]
MLITSYNPAALGDVLIAITAPSSEKDLAETKNNVTVIMSPSGDLVGINFLKVSDIIDVKAFQAGQVFLTSTQIDQLNQAIVNAGFEVQLDKVQVKLVVGYVRSAEEHPDSDHLKVTSTEVGDGQMVQIVSGSPNMQANIKVVVAQIGTMMPNGLIIWPGELRGVASNGMIVSGRELNLPNAPTQPGALILPDDFAPIGTIFDPQDPAAQKLFQGQEA